eukprot:789100-Alexandrium_andersonii.AAC.1
MVRTQQESRNASRVARPRFARTGALVQPCGIPAWTCRAGVLGVCANSSIHALHGSCGACPLPRSDVPLAVADVCGWRYPSGQNA